nr:MAG TPA: hypothetical protein [Caudoviricetes sp.]
MSPCFTTRSRGFLFTFGQVFLWSGLSSVRSFLGQVFSTCQILQQLVDFVLRPDDLDVLPEPQQLFVRDALGGGDTAPAGSLCLYPHNDPTGQEHDPIRPPAIVSGVEFDAPTACRLDLPPEILLHRAL